MRLRQRTGSVATCAEVCRIGSAKRDGGCAMSDFKGCHGEEEIVVVKVLRYCPDGLGDRDLSAQGTWWKPLRGPRLRTRPGMRAFIGLAIASSLLSSSPTWAQTPSDFQSGLAAYDNNGHLIRETAAEALNKWFASKADNDTRNVKDFGAKLNGTTDDTAAFAAARAAAPVGPNITTVMHVAGYGPLNVTSLPTSSNGSQVLWTMDGALTKSGAPITGIGTDTVENVWNGSRWYTRANTSPASQPLVQIDDNVNHTGGEVGEVMDALHVNCVLPSTGGDMNTFDWCISSTIYSSATGPGEHLALDSTAFRPPNALSDGRGARAVLDAGYDEVNDQTGQAANYSGSVVGRETDVYANDTDNGPPSYGNRIILSLNAGNSLPNGVPARVHRGLALGDGGTAYMGTPIDVEAHWDTAGIDLTLGHAVTTTYLTRAAPVGATLTFGDVDDVLVGQAATGSGVPAGDTVRTVDYAAKTVTLSVAPAPDLATGTNVTFTSIAPAIATGHDKAICLDGYTSACLHSNSGIAFNATGTEIVGFDTVNMKLSSGVALRIGQGQSIAWEGTSAIHTSWNGSQLLTSNASTPLSYTDSNGDAAIGGHAINFGSLPTAPICGLRPIVAPGSTDQSGSVEIGTGSGSRLCVIAFVHPFRQGHCVVTSPSGMILTGYTEPVMGSLGISYRYVAGAKINWNCTDGT